MSAAVRQVATNPREILARAAEGVAPEGDEAFALLEIGDLDPLVEVAAGIRDRAFGSRLTYSPKVFIPLTQLCRDSCAYCTFAHPPRRGTAAFLSPDEVLEIASRGVAAGCGEVLFTLGDKPELRYASVRAELARLRHETTLSYLAEMASLVLRETGLLPHINAGVMSGAEISALRRVSVSQGLMLETASERLSARGGPHFGSPDKHPAARLATILAAGQQGVPFTSGILIGIGETRRDRIAALLALRDAYRVYRHLQEIIVQNFRAKLDTRMSGAPEPSFEDHLWTIAVARIILPPEISVQAPPNLAAGSLGRLIQAGINDFGGISPLTRDHVNPEAPWPEVARLEAEGERESKVLVPRLAAYPAYVQDEERWLDSGVVSAVKRLSDAEGFFRQGRWRPGAAVEPILLARRPAAPAVPAGGETARIINTAVVGRGLGEDEIVSLFEARGHDLARVIDAADELRQNICGDEVTFVVNRNINYTNVCYFRCQFCAFSKGKLSENLRGKPYDLALDEIGRRAAEAWDRGATEVCLQGGIHPGYTGATYLAILRAVKAAAPDIHVHAFSPLEVRQGAATLGVSVAEFLQELRATGLGSLPGTAAEILDDEVRQIICKDKLTTDEWLGVMEAAHRIGLRSTATVMFGHVDRPRHWARHLARIRELQSRTGGFTEFVPLPFVPDETPIYLKGRARQGATLRETVLMHAVARLALHSVVGSVQTSWVKLGPAGAKLALEAGANDIGGTLMNETISRAAGASHGQELEPAAMEDLIRRLGRKPRQRTTLYGAVAAERQIAGRLAATLSEPVNTPARAYERHA